jgi:hypothetical protein
MTSHDEERIQCPQCEKVSLKRNLLHTETLACRGCGSLFETRERFRQTSDETAAHEDLHAIETWLAEVAKLLDVARLPEKWPEEIVWQVSAPLLPWPCEVVYDERRRRVAEVRLRLKAVETPIPNIDVMQDVCDARSVLLSGTIGTSPWWAVGHLVSTFTLRATGLRPVIDRLEEAVREIIAKDA